MKPDPWAAPPTAQEAGNRATEQPGMLRRALTWATTPFENYKPIIERQRQIANHAGPAPLGLTKDSGDALAGLHALVSGVPGYQPDAQSDEEQARTARFHEDHPIASILLPLAGGLGTPAMLPSTIAASAQGPGVLESLANKLAARTLRGTAGEYKQLGDEGVQGIGRFLLNRKAVRLGSSPAGVAERVASLPEATGQELGSAIGALDQTGGQVSKRALADQFQRLAEEAKAGGPGAVPLALKYEKAAADVLKDIEVTGEPAMSFKQAEQWKRAYQAPINYAKSTSTPLEMGSKEIASAARQGVEDAASVAGEGTPLGEQFLQAKQQSGLAQQAARMAEGAEGRRAARNMLSPSGVATSLAGVATAVASGHPAAAMPALALGPGMQFLRSRGPSTLAVLLDAASKGGARIGELAAENPGAVGRASQAFADLLHEGDTPRLQAILEALRQKRSASPQSMASND